MKRKSVILLISLLIIELTLLGVYFLRPFQQTETTKNNVIRSSSESTNRLTRDSTNAVSADTTHPDTSKWLTSDTDISFPILMYHSLAESEGNSLKVPPREFKEHMKWLKEQDYYTLSPEEAYLVLTENKKPAEHIVWITLDDGYLNNYTEGFPILKELNMKATINFITSKRGSSSYFNVDNMTEMKDSSLINIESHTVSHLDLNTLEDAQIETELVDSQNWLNDTLHQDTTLLCYPAGRYDERVKTIAEKVGYKLAITTEPGYAKKSDGLFALKRVRISPGYDGESFGAFVVGNQ
ncbi:MAG: polysaccharide deacetylase family protein [Vagococcus sp.]